MKTKLLFFLFLYGIINVNAQTTHNLNWRIGIGTNLNLTIDVGDTVIWTWTDSAPHTVTNKSGSTETFDSGTESGIGTIFSKTFTMVGSNPYQCDIHPGSMAGTITVENALGVDDFLLKGFSISPNPATDFIKVQFSESISNVQIEIFNVLGKQVYSKLYTANTPIDISNLMTGFYIVKASSDGISKTKKIMKY